MLFRLVFGAPNYGIGVVIGVTLACYFYGVWSAAACLVLAVAGLYLEAVEPGGLEAAIELEAWPRIAPIALTSTVTSGLVVLLRQSQRRLARSNENLLRTQKELADALERERTIATTMQTAFLPSVPRKIGGVGLAAAYRPGLSEAELGGDFYDVMELPDGKLAVALGDVSGKGVTAARHAVIARYGLRSYVLRSLFPSAALAELNRLLMADPEFSGFVTIFLGLLDTNTRELVYCTGGHEPPLVYRAGNVETLRTNGHVVGALPQVEYREDALALEAGDVLFIYSDGLSEAHHGGEFLGSEGLGRILSQSIDRSDLDECVTAVVDAAREFAGGRFHDDVAALVLRID